MSPGHLPLEVFLAMSSWEETSEQTLEELYISLGLGRPWDPPGAAQKCPWGEGCLEPSK